MSECKTEESCETSKGSCDTPNKSSSDCCTVAQDFLCLAKQAKKELMKEKMKAAFEKKLGKKMEALADVATDAVIACFEHEMAGRDACNNYKENLLKAFKS